MKLTAFYSRAGGNYFGGSIRAIKEGNTAKVASMIAEAAGTEVFEIRQKVPYSYDYQKCTEEAKRDQEGDVRPAIEPFAAKEPVTELFLGFPNYWGTMPMAVLTFLDSIDTDGLVIHPFITHEGSEFGHALNDLARLYPKALIRGHLAIRGSSVDSAEKKVRDWVEGL